MKSPAISTVFLPALTGLLFVLFSNSSRAQSCQSNQIVTRWSFELAGIVSSAEILPGGGYIMSGKSSYRQTIMRTNAAGDAVWTKRYSYAEILTTHEYSFLHSDNDGNFFSSVNSEAVAMIDGNGSVLTMKELDNGNPNIVIYDGAVLPNNNKVLVAKDESAYGFTRFLLICLSPNLGSIVWMKYVSSTVSYFSLRALHIKGDTIFVLGGHENQGSLMLFKGDGTFLQQHFLKVENSTATPLKMYPYPNGFLMTGVYTENLESKHWVMRLDANLNVVRAYRPGGITQTGDLFIVPAPDGSYYGTWGTGAFGHYRFFCTRNDSIVWNRLNYVPALSRPSAIFNTDQGLLVLGNGIWNPVGVGGQYGYSAGLSDGNGALTGCVNSSFQIGTYPLAFTQTNGNLVVGDTSMLNLVNVTPVINDLVITRTTNCSATGICNNLSIVGPGNVCTSAEVIYKAPRNSGCARPVQWNVSGGNAETQIYSDSTIGIKFLQQGVYRLIASIGSDCQPLDDTIYINKLADTAPLELGASPMTLCEGNTILLTAPTGFTSYVWQDGSTAMSYLVSVPGIYHVAVTNLCGEILRDTVVVNYGAPIPLSIGPDRTICLGDTVHLQASPGFDAYSWGPNYFLNTTSGQSVIARPVVDTVYYVRAAHISGCFAYDTVRIYVNNAQAINLGPDINLCEGKTALIDAGAGFLNYQWSNGQSTQQAVVSAVGAYSVIGTNANGCNSYDTLQVLNVWPSPVISLDSRNTLCEGESRVLDPGTFATYTWQDASVNPTFTVTGIGLYHVTVSNDYSCFASDTVRINTILASPDDFLPPAMEICNYGLTELRPAGSFASYHWSNGSDEPLISLDQGGIYWLQVTDGNECTGTDSTFVSVKECLKGLFMPTAFTPNNDGLNDVIKPTIGGNLKLYSFSVINRWGQTVYFSRSINKGWDGRVGGILQDSGVYIWICHYQLEGQAVQLGKGSFMLIR